MNEILLRSRAERAVEMDICLFETNDKMTSNKSQGA